MALYCRGLAEASVAPLVEAADIYRTVGRPLLLAMALEAAGEHLAEHGDVPPARRMFREALDTYADLAAAADLSRVERRLREFGIRRGPRVVRRPVSGVDSLSPTELRVAHLAAEGMSNPQIADRLFLSRRTVTTHVSKILGKLSLGSRAQIARALAGASASAARN
jgi:DNA-binding CsgD family transcriptional regulator